MGKIEDLYIHHYKRLLIIPLVLLILSLSILGYNYVKTGEIIKKDVSLQGGISLTISSEQIFQIDSIKNQLQKEFPKSDVSIRELTDFSNGKNLGIAIDMSNVKATDVNDKLSSILNMKFNDSNYSVEEIGSSLGESFLKEMIFAIIFSILFMAITVLITFRKIIPSVAVISSIVLELIVTIAVLSLMNHKLSPAGIAALLMVMGYSIDTDILLTTRVLKRDTGTLFQRIKSATKTGVTMTSTTLAVSVLMMLTPSAVLKEIFTIIFIALVVDLISTWVMNAALLVWYLDHHNKKNENI